MVLERFTHLAQNIKALRITAGLSVQELAGLANVQEAVLANVENFRTIPDLLFLNNISIALKITLPELINDLTGFRPDKPYFLLRSEAREKLERADSEGIDYEIIMTKYITPCLFIPTIVTIRNGVSRPPVTTNGLEFFMVLSGSVITGLADEIITLHEGDAVFYDARMPHFLENNFGQDCRLLSLYLMNEN